MPSSLERVWGCWSPRDDTELVTSRPGGLKHADDARRCAEEVASTGREARNGEGPPGDPSQMTLVRKLVTAFLYGSSRSLFGTIRVQNGKVHLFGVPSPQIQPGQAVSVARPCK